MDSFTTANKSILNPTFLINTMGKVASFYGEYPWLNILFGPDANYTKALACLVACWRLPMSLYDGIKLPKSRCGGLGLDNFLGIWLIIGRMA
jgi:hypothetical protein